MTTVLYEIDSITDSWENLQKNLKESESWFKEHDYIPTDLQFDGTVISFNPDRFTMLKATHPKLWEYCMKPK